MAVTYNGLQDFRVHLEWADAPAAQPIAVRDFLAIVSAESLELARLQAAVLVRELKGFVRVKDVVARDRILSDLS